MRGGQPAGPIDIRNAGEEALVAEFAASPGVRLQDCFDKMEDHQLLAVGNRLPKIQSPYRRQILRKRLHHALWDRWLPTPKTFRVRVRRGYTSLMNGVCRLVRLLLLSLRADFEQPELAAFARANTVVAPRPAKKISQRLVSEKAGSLSFDCDAVEQLAPETREWLAHEAGTEVFCNNYDIPEGACRQELMEETMSQMVGWSRWFQLPFSEKVIHEQVSRLPAIRRAPEHVEHLELTPEDPKWGKTVGGRLNKDETTLHRSPEVGYWCALHSGYLANTRTDSKLRWSAEKAVLYCKTVYYKYFP